MSLDVKVLGAAAAVLFVLWTAGYCALLFVAAILDRTPDGLLEPLAAAAAVGALVFVAGRFARRAWLAGAGIGVHAAVLIVLPLAGGDVALDYAGAATVALFAGAFSAWTLTVEDVPDLA